jgi:hypothetical protein
MVSTRLIAFLRLKIIAYLSAIPKRIRISPQDLSSATEKKRGRGGGGVAVTGHGCSSLGGRQVNLARKLQLLSNSIFLFRSESRSFKRKFGFDHFHLI